MKALAAVAKPSKFIRLLTLDRPGEVVVAARAIVRTLEGAEADIHELAEGIGATPVNGKKFAEANARETDERGAAGGPRAAGQAQPATRHHVDDDGRPWLAIVNEWAVHFHRLRDKRERNFAADIVVRVRR
jgi:hypothetical protein